MNLVFTCDRESADKVDRSVRISQTGKYIGLITQCELAQSPNGAQYVEFAFKALEWDAKDEHGEVSHGEGSMIDFIRLYITSNSGEPTFNRSILDALMTVLKIDKMEGKPANVFERDGSKRQGYRIPELEKQKVGFLLQRENYTYTKNNEPKEGFQMILQSAFDPVTGKCASEIIRGADKAVTIDSRFKNMADRQRKQNGTASTTGSSTARQVTNSASLDALKEDIPF